MKTPDLTRLTFTMHALPWDGPEVRIRVRRFLKNALRSYGLKCVKIEVDEAKEDVPIAEEVAQAG